ncbi:MAG: calcium-binding protein [Waterburya sp.]
MAVINGTTGNDTLNGTNQNDIINGLSGEDQIFGANGDDLISGGSGFDILGGDAGNDTVFAGSSGDLILIGDGIDTVFGGAGDDTLQFSQFSATTDIDIVYTNTNLGTISDGSRFSQVESLNFYSGSGNDNANVTAFSNTVIYTGEGNDTIKSGNGDDILRGEAGNDFIDAGDGNDSIDTLDRGYGGSTGIDTVIGGSGEDGHYINRLDTNTNFTVNYTDINNGTVSDGSQFREIETFGFNSGSGNDDIQITAATAYVSGGAGNDTIIGGAYNDNLDSGEGNDLINAGGGDDYVYTSAGIDTVIGGSGNDSLTLIYYSATDDLTINYTDINNGTVSDGSRFQGFESIFITTGSGNDSINSTIKVTDLFAGAGSDRVSSSAQDDYLFGEEGADSLKSNGGNDTLIGGSGIDTLTGGSGEDNFRFENPTDGFDRLVDFNVNDDLIEVLSSNFGGGLVEGSSLSVDQFVIGSAATDSSDRFIYNNTNGALFFDVDGNGSTAQVQLATLNTGLALTNQDIFVL